MNVTLCSAIVNNGIVYHFRRSGDEWSLQSTLASPDYPGMFGQNLAISGNLAVVGTNGPHVAYIYKLIAGVWEFQNTMDNGALAVALSGSTCMVVDLLRPQSIRVYQLGIDSDNDDDMGLDDSKKELNKDTVTIAASVGGGVAFVLLAACSILCVCMKRSGKYKSNVVPSENKGAIQDAEEAG